MTDIDAPRPRPSVAKDIEYQGTIRNGGIAPVQGWTPEKEHSPLTPEDNFRIRVSHKEGAKRWTSEITVELTGNVESLGYSAIKIRLAALSALAQNRQATDRAELNFRDGYIETLEYPESEE